jgi:hypothetical protein
MMAPNAAIACLAAILHRAHKAAGHITKRVRGNRAARHMRPSHLGRPNLEADKASDDEHETKYPKHLLRLP